MQCIWQIQYRALTTLVVLKERVSPRTRSAHLIRLLSDPRQASHLSHLIFSLSLISLISHLFTFSHISLISSLSFHSLSSHLPTLSLSHSSALCVCNIWIKSLCFALLCSVLLSALLCSAFNTSFTRQQTTDNRQQNKLILFIRTYVCLITRTVIGIYAHTYARCTQCNLYMYVNKKNSHTMSSFSLSYTHTRSHRPEVRRETLAQLLAGNIHEKLVTVRVSVSVCEWC